MTKRLLASALLLLGLLGLPGPATAWDTRLPDTPASIRGDDKDADGVLDSLDNCLLHANVSQRDTDRDGFGNACDPDFNGDGIVDSRDQELLIDKLGSPGRAERPGIRDFDLNEDARVDRRDLAILGSFLGMPPGPRQDVDRDGAADLEDACRGTPRGFERLLLGCSALDIVESPESLLRPLLAGIADVAALLRTSPEMTHALNPLEAAHGPLESAARLLRAGDPCQGASSFEEARRAIDQAYEAAEAVLQAAGGDLPPPTEGDNEPVDTFRFMLDLIGRVRSDGSVVGPALARICAGAGPIRTAFGTVRNVTDSPGRLELGDGRLFTFADPLRTDGFIAPGVRVGLKGTDLGLDAGVLTEVIGQPALAASAVECLRLDFVPVQPSAPDFPGPYVLHHPDGYLSEGKYRVELGMGFAARPICSSAPEDTVYTIELTLVYDGGKTHTLAPALDAADAPVKLPYWLDPFPAAWTDAVLEARSYSRVCSSNICGVPKLIRHRSYPLQVFRQRGLCLAEYDRNRLEVDDQIAEDFETIQVVDFFGPYGFPSASVAFGAEAYAANGPKQVVAVGKNQPFAVYSEDFYPVMPFAPGLQGLFGRVHAQAVTGVTAASGVKWPRVQGVVNGRPWQYSCSVDKVVRDVVEFCSPSPDSLYRLPFASGAPDWTLNWGNFQGSHDGYAYDMGSNPTCGAEIRAARAGRVIDEYMGICNSSAPPSPPSPPSLCGYSGCGSVCCQPGEDTKGKLIRVRHQDGIGDGIYRHMRPDGVYVAAGDVVRRGELIGLVGATGNAAGPHLHMSSKEGPGETYLVLFEALDPQDPAQLLQCYEPQQDDTLKSTNALWPPEP